MRRSLLTPLTTTLDLSLCLQSDMSDRELTETGHGESKLPVSHRAVTKHVLATEFWGGLLQHGWLLQLAKSPFTHTPKLRAKNEGRKHFLILKFFSKDLQL